LAKFYLGNKFAILAGLTLEYWTDYHNNDYKSFNLNLTPGFAFDFSTNNLSGLQLTYDFGLINMKKEDGEDNCLGCCMNAVPAPATKVLHIVITTFICFMVTEGKKNLVNHYKYHRKLLHRGSWV
tara:strand:+ start:583 stop:957 length:375 start_codon:yes stop_codon:yes gene_type:complete